MPGLVASNRSIVGTSGNWFGTGSKRFATSSQVFARKTAAGTTHLLPIVCQVVPKCLVPVPNI